MQPVPRISIQHIIVRLGALIVGMSNLEVARYLLKSGLEWAQGCVFLDDNDEQMILMRGSSQRIVRLKESGLPWDKRFTFYDQAIESRCT